MAINHNEGSKRTQADITLSLKSGTISNWAVISQDNKSNSTTITNVGSGVTTPHIQKYQVTKVANIYNGADIERTMQSPLKRGTRLYHQVRQNWTVPADAATGLSSYTLPVSGSISLTIPDDPSITVEDVRAILMNVVETFYWNGGVRLGEELRGQSNPLMTMINS